MITLGDAIPEWVMESVSAERMRTMAAILRDPNPVHWDRDAVAALPLGLGRRTINQGPLGLAYIINMLHAWSGPTSLRRIKMTFPQVVLDGERVTAKGIVTGIESDRVHCDVWLEEATRGILLSGTATVVPDSQD
ncbi:MAG: MaoC family dehydratase [Halioglobus sp.]